MSHTPGPWYHRAVEGGWDGVDTDEGVLICRLAENNPANAIRIAACVNACEGINPEAVPDLLEALKDVLAESDRRTIAYLKAHNAIAKAEEGL